MAWLYWKEYRLQRLVLTTGLFLLVMPYALCLNTPSAETTSFAAVFSTILSIVTLALLGGNAIASERADRSAEFQAYQPITRSAILSTKMVLPVLAALVLWGVNLYVYERWSPAANTGLPGREWMYVFIAFGFYSFSVAWLFSALQNSATFAAGAGMAAPIATLWLLALLGWLGGRLGMRPSGQNFETVWVWVNLALGLLCFTIGSWHYLRRVEP